jgi:pilus assembly protein TadC
MFYRDGVLLRAGVTLSLLSLSLISLGFFFAYWAWMASAWGLAMTGSFRLCFLVLTVILPYTVILRSFGRSNLFAIWDWIASSFLLAMT